jgi:hypothetical protein
MTDFVWHCCDNRPDTPKKRYVARCDNCGLFSQMELAITFPQGGTVECIGCMHLIPAFDVDIGSPGAAIQWRGRPASFKREQLFNLLCVLYTGRINAMQCARGILRPATNIWFADQVAGGMLCVCPEILKSVEAGSR